MRVFSPMVVRLALAVICVVRILDAQAESIPVDSPRWRHEGKTILTEYLGRRCPALEDDLTTLKDFEMTDGVIDADMARSGARGPCTLEHR